jgi:hypothetical protein
LNTLVWTAQFIHNSMWCWNHCLAWNGQYEKLHSKEQLKELNLWDAMNTHKCSLTALYTLHFTFTNEKILSHSQTTLFACLFCHPFILSYTSLLLFYYFIPFQTCTYA